MKEPSLDEFLDTCIDLDGFGDYDYQWWEFRAWYDPKGRVYYWASESGCSCYSFFDYIDSISDLSCGSKEELTRAAKEEGEGGYEGFEKFMDDLRRFKP